MLQVWLKQLNGLIIDTVFFKGEQRTKETRLIHHTLGFVPRVLDDLDTILVGHRVNLINWEKTQQQHTIEYQFHQEWWIGQISDERNILGGDGRERLDCLVKCRFGLVQLGLSLSFALHDDLFVLEEFVANHLNIILSLLCLFSLMRDILEHFCRFLLCVGQASLLVCKFQFELFNIFCSTLKYIETTVHLLHLGIDLIVLGLIYILVQLNETEIRLWSGVHVSTESLKVTLRYSIHGKMDARHVMDERLFHLCCRFHFVVIEEFVGNTHKSILWPWEEPVNVASTDQTRELQSTISESVTNRTEAQHNV
mmetsp:Transcript_2558/g.9709  ORF Transcript_2558/g.9709 Transcript_2558/m.9709 type:complete len:310 (-) Transcript_2558:9227-10156(-)